MKTQITISENFFVSKKNADKKNTNNDLKSP